MDVSCAGAGVYCIDTFCNRICLATIYYIHFVKVMKGFPCLSSLPNEERKWKKQKIYEPKNYVSQKMLFCFITETIIKVR